MGRKTFIAGLAALLLLAVWVGPATADTCTRYRNHSGWIPASYDYGYGQEYSNGQLIDTFNIPGGQNAGRPSNGGTWDYVWKCHATVTTTTTVPDTTTTTTVIVTTTTVPDTTTTTVPDTTTTTVPDTTTTTVPETTTTVPETTTTTEATTTTQPEVTTTIVVTTTTVDPCGEEGSCLPVTGPSNLIPFGLVGVLLLALGVGLLSSSKRKK